MLKYYVLLVDDKVEFAHEFQRQAQNYNIKVIHKTNYKDMETALPSIADKLAAAILDIKCLKEPNQLMEGEDFLTLALELLNGKYQELPRAILTADPEGYSIAKKWYTQERLFKKIPGDIETLFEYIITKGSERENQRIRIKYSDIFSVFERGQLDLATENELLNLIKQANKNELAQIKNNLALIRRIQEKIFQTVNKQNKTILPDSCFKANKDLLFWDAHNHLSDKLRTGNVYYSGIPRSFSSCIYHVASDNGSHNPYESPEYQPTTYTVNAMLFALFDLMRWFSSKI